MPITVRHEPGGGMAALAGLMGGQGKQATQEGEQRARSADILTQLDSRRRMQQEQIQAQAEAQGRASDDTFKRDAIRAGLAEQVQQREFDNELTKMREEAKVKASQWEYQYTTEQRREIARYNQADQLIDQSDSFSEEEKLIMHRQVEQGRMGIIPVAVPADPNKQAFAEGREPGNEFQDQGGNWHMVQPDGSSKMTLRWDQGPEAAKMKYEAAAEEARMKREEDRRYKKEEQIDEYRRELIGIKVKNERGAEVGLTKGQIEERMQWAFPGENRAFMQAPEKRERLAAIRKQRAAERASAGAAVPGLEQPEFDVTQTPRNLIGASRDVRLTDEDRELPGFVGKAKAFLRGVREKVEGGEEVPSWMGPAIEEATAIMRDHASKGGQ